MRLVGTLSNENSARRFCAYLQAEKIDANCDIAFDSATGHLSYSIWVKDEDQIAKASEMLLHFEQNPSDPRYDAAPPPAPPEEPGSLEEEPLPKRQNSPITTFLMIVCSFVFLLNFVEQQKLSPLSFTKVQKLFFYDFPENIAPLEQALQKYQIGPDTKLEELPAEAQQEILAASQIPYWRGLYDWLLLKASGADPKEAVGPMFVKIGQGEFWRLFSPCILHRDLLHILFNMIWIWVLCRPIEQRIGGLRTLALSIAIGIFSNTAQYLASGPFFLGYSGIVTGLAGFIWMREKAAPWEGYPLNRSTLLFLAFFVLAMFALQAGSFFLLLFTDMNFTPSIANTAHISGALFGALLARLPYFAARPLP